LEDVQAYEVKFMENKVEKKTVDNIIEEPVVEESVTVETSAPVAKVVEEPVESVNNGE